MAERPRIGSEFAGYRIEAQAGRGGASVVYQAVNLALGNRVALKVLAPEFFDDDAVRERFVRESQIAASINHPNIIPIHAAGDADGYLYIVMRFVEGADLKALIAERGALPPARVMNIVRQVGRALDTAHQRGLVHRDVKPANVLLEQIGTDHEHAYLADFGLTKRTGSRSGLTGSGHFIGTIDYMAPEQIEGAAVDGRADIYALACLVYQCLTGLVPFPKDVEMAVLYAHMNEVPPSASASRPGLPPTVDRVIARGMAKSPADRYATCAEIVAALDAALAGNAVASPPEQQASPPPETEQVPARSPQPEAAPVPLAAPVPTPPSQPVAPGPPERRSRWPLVAAVVGVIAFAALGGYYLSSRSGNAGASDGMGSSVAAEMTNLERFAFVSLGSHTCPGTTTRISCTNPPTLHFHGHPVNATSISFTQMPSSLAVVEAFRGIQSAYHIGENTGQCLADKVRRHPLWGHEDDWWHNYRNQAEHQDGTDTHQRDLQRLNGYVLCANDKTTGQAVVVWTQQGTTEPAGNMSQHGIWVLGRVTAHTPLAAYRYWYAAHHHDMVM